MKTGTKRLILAAFVLTIAEAAMAAQPKATIDTDEKNAKAVNLVVTSQDGDAATYRCQYSWNITFKGGGQATDNCSADIPTGTSKATACTRTYDRRVDQVQLIEKSCKPI